MIKSLLDADTEETGLGSQEVASSASTGSFLDLKIPEKAAESIDPFAITDLHSLTPLEPSVVSVSEDLASSFAEPEAGPGQPTKNTDHTPEYFAPTTAETIRMSGLAWSAGIMFFGSVGLMMVFGWLVDTVLGSSPWGIVGGIVLGSVIGFVQLVRINTQLLKSTSSAPRSLLEQAAAENDKKKVSAVPEGLPAIESIPEISTAPLTEESDESARSL